MRLDPKSKAIELATLEPVVALSHATVWSVMKLMVEHGVRRIPIVSEGGKLVGIVIHRSLLDYLCGGPRSKLWVEGMRGDFSRALDLPIENIMSTNVISAPFDATVWDVLNLLLKTGLGGVPLVKDGRVEGIISERDFVRFFPEKVGIPVDYHMTRHVFTLSPSDRLDEACRKMVSLGIRRLPVVQENNLVGIFTAMDALSCFTSPTAYEMITEGRQEELFGKRIEQIMTRNVVTVGSGADLGTAARLMRENGFSGLPVIRKGKLAGIISEHDLLGWLFYALYPKRPKR
jgi:CBS domain-containing protein